MECTEKPTGQRIPKAVWVLGFVSLLMDVSSEMIHAVLPLFLTVTLGASAGLVGLMEGMAESTALIAKVFSGVIADRFGHKKYLILLGYGIAVASKPVFALSQSVGLCFAARFANRLGKGLRGAPRDALVAEAAPKTLWGAAYGLRHALDAAGAFLGPALAALLLFLWTENYREIFWIALIPGIACLLLIIFGVHEKEESAVSGTTHAPFNLKAALKEITPALRVLLVLTALVSAARCSNAFLLLRAADTGIPAAAVPLIIVGLNAVFSLSAYPFGKLADTVSESLLLVTGLIFLAAGNLFLAWVPSTAGIAAGIIFWGLHMGAVQGVMSKLTASAAGPGNRATAFGLASFTAGITLLAANTVFGVLWSAAGAAVSFTIGALFAVVAVISALRLKKTLSQNRATKVP